MNDIRKALEPFAKFADETKYARFDGIIPGANVRVVDAERAAKALSTLASEEVTEDDIAAVMGEHLSIDNAFYTIEGIGTAARAILSRLLLSTPKRKAGDTMVRDGKVLRFIEEEIEGEKWEIVGEVVTHPPVAADSTKGKLSANELAAIEIARGVATKMGETQANAFPVSWNALMQEGQRTIGALLAIISRLDLRSEVKEDASTAAKLFNALRAWTEYWAYGMAKPDGAEPSPEDDRRVEELADIALDALRAYEPNYVPAQWKPPLPSTPSDQKKE